MQLEINELKYHGIGLCVRDTLKNQVVDTVCFVVSVDESLNEVTQASEMDICLRFWDKENNQAEDRYWDPNFLEHTTHQHLLGPVHEGFKVFNMAKIVQLSTNGPKLNLKLSLKLKEQRNELGSSGLIDFGSCNLQIVLGAFKSGAEASEWNF